MRAAVIREHGGLEQVRVEEISEPRCADDEVILNVRSAGLNHLAGDVAQLLAELEA